MTHAPRPTLLGTVLAVTCLAALFPAGSFALDNPTIDTRKSECVYTVTQELVQQLPTAGRTFEPLAGIVPGQARLEFKLNSRQRPEDFIFIDGVNRWDFERVRFNERDCSVKGEIRRAQFGTSGYSGRLELISHTRPEDRVYLRAYDLKLNGSAIRGEQLWFFKPYGTPGTEQPPPGQDTPSNPPAAPVPITPGFVTPYGVTLYDGTLFQFNMNVLPHNNHDAHSVLVGGTRRFLCIDGPGQTQARTRNVTTSGFELEKTAEPRPGWGWGPFQCDPTGCKGDGSFYGTPIRATTSDIRLDAASRNVTGNMDLWLSNSRVPFRFTGTYTFPPPPPPAP